MCSIQSRLGVLHPQEAEGQCCHAAKVTAHVGAEETDQGSLTGDPIALVRRCRMQALIQSSKLILNPGFAQFSVKGRFPLCALNGLMPNYSVVCSGLCTPGMT